MLANLAACNIHREVEKMAITISCQRIQGPSQALPAKNLAMQTNKHKMYAQNIIDVAHHLALVLKNVL